VQRQLAKADHHRCRLHHALGTEPNAKSDVSSLEPTAARTPAVEDQPSIALGCYCDISLPKLTVAGAVCTTRCGTEPNA